MAGIEWESIESAPRDGTVIIGKDGDGREARIRSQKLHPKVDIDIWVMREDVTNPNWVRREMFYPVAWRRA